jgi:ribosomal protein S8
MENFRIGSLMSKLNLAKKHKKDFIVEKKTILVKSILDLLFKKNLIKTYTSTKNKFIVSLKPNMHFLIKDFAAVSLPSKRKFVSMYELSSFVFKQPLTFYILSTPLGILEASEALNKKVGGEILFKIIL